MPKYEDEGIVEDNDDLETEEGGKKKGKGTTAIIAAFIVVIWIAIFALLVKLDVGGFGSSVLYPVLKDVPVLNKILPNVSDNSLSSNSGDTYSTLQEAIDRINELENSIAVYKKNSDENAQTISNLTAEVERLKTYEANQTAFETLKKDLIMRLFIRIMHPIQMNIRIGMNRWMPIMRQRYTDRYWSSSRWMRLYRILQIITLQWSLPMPRQYLRK